MTYRKFKGDYLFTGRDLVAPGSVLVTTEEGIVEAVLPSTEAGEGIEYLDGMISPGFVNCHCHLELSHMRGLLPERTGLVDFLLAVMKQRNAAGAAGASVGTSPGAATPAPAVSAEHIRSAIADAEEYMLQNGIVAVGDICNTADTLPQKMAGRLYYHNFIETMGFIEQRAPDRFAHGLATFESFAGAYSLPIESNSLVPHAPYSVSPRLFGLIANFPGNHLVTIHNQENEAENEFYQTGKGDLLRLYQALGLDVSFFAGTGKRSLESYLPHFYRNQSLILVHNVATGEEDLRHARGALPNLYFCLCPNANLYIDGQLPDPDLLIRHHCTIVMGTDSLASNHQLSILEECKTLQREFPHLQTATLLQWATKNGAEALQMDRVLGSFARGKQPGVVLIENMEGSRLGAAASARRLL
jgi:aminodeoxyfutalosine deaminase